MHQKGVKSASEGIFYRCFPKNHDKLAILEPMFQRLQDRLFGETGFFDPNDPQGSMSKVSAVISEFFGKGGEGERTITAATEFMVSPRRPQTCWPGT